MRPLTLFHATAEQLQFIQARLFQASILLQHIKCLFARLSHDCRILSRVEQRTRNNGGSGVDSRDTQGDLMACKVIRLITRIIHLLRTRVPCLLQYLSREQDIPSCLTSLCDLGVDYATRGANMLAVFVHSGNEPMDKPSSE